VTEPLRIGFDIRALSGASARRGVGAYIRGLLSGMEPQLAGAGGVMTLFGNGAEDSSGLPEGFVRVRLSRPRRAITLWDQIAWPPLLARRRVRVFHSPFYAVPRLTPPRCRVVQTVHDLTPLKLPGTVSRRNARIFAANFRLARSADRIIVPSAATGRDVVSLLRVPGEKVVTIPEACDIDDAAIDAADAARAALLSRLGLSGRRYLLHAGGHDIVKNLPGLLQAFSLLAAGSIDLDLVIAGEHGRETGGLIARAGALSLFDRVRLPGFLPRADLIALYRGASALVYPSFTEGFGLPVMEAMRCGTPVVASTAEALRETGGDACLYAPATDPEAIATAVASILEDASRAERLSRAGRERAAGFTWEETARRTLSVYREVAA